METAWEMDVDWVVKWSLDESIAEVDTPSLKIKEQSVVHDQPNGRPHNNWSVSVFLRRLEIAADAPPSLVTFEGAVGVSFASQGPSAG